MFDPSFWDQHYQRGETPWDMKRVSPPLKAYFDQLTDKTRDILIPGCGNSYEAGYLKSEGFMSITLVDISEVLMRQLYARFGDTVYLITGDFFDLRGQYDLIIEQTFFCALDPSLRAAYVEQAFDLLRPGGKLVGLLFDRDFQGGPPFGGHRDEYAPLLEKRFTIRTLEPCYNSIKPRAGTELFFIAEKPD